MNPVTRTDSCICFCRLKIYWNNTRFILQFIFSISSRCEALCMVGLGFSTKHTFYASDCALYIMAIWIFLSYVTSSRQQDIGIIYIYISTKQRRESLVQHLTQTCRERLFAARWLENVSDPISPHPHTSFPAVCPRNAECTEAWRPAIICFVSRFSLCLSICS